MMIIAHLMMVIYCKNTLKIQVRISELFCALIYPGIVRRLHKTERSSS